MQNLISNIYSQDLERLQNSITNAKLNLLTYRGQDGLEYASRPDTPNPTGDRIGGMFLNSFIRRKYAESGHRLKSKELDDINEDLKSAAHAYGFKASVWYRVAQIPNGIEIDLVFTIMS